MDTEQTRWIGLAEQIRERGLEIDARGNREFAAGGDQFVEAQRFKMIRQFVERERFWRRNGRLLGRLLFWGTGFH